MSSSKATYNVAMTNLFTIRRAVWYVCPLLAWCCLAAAGESVWSAEPQSAIPDLTGDVLSYLDEPDGTKAEAVLQQLLANPEITIDQASRAIQTGRTYQALPVGTMAEQQILVRERTYHYALSVPLTYQPGKGYGLVVCLHGAGFSGDAYLERWQSRLSDDYILVCPTYPSGAWFTRQAEDLVLAVIEQVQAQYHVDPDRVFLTGMSNGGIGTWLIGMHHAQRFAGLAPMASGLDGVLMPFLASHPHLESIAKIRFWFKIAAGLSFPALRDSPSDLTHLVGRKPEAYGCMSRI